MKHLLFILLIISLFSGHLMAQGSLLDEMGGAAADSAAPEAEAFPGTFETVRLVNGHSTEMPGKGALQFMIMHRFGALSGGGYELFGLDQASMRFGFEYGITNRITVGVGRSNLNKTYDGYLKVKLLQQKASGMPVTLVWMSDIAAWSTRWAVANHPNNYFTHRLSYTHQLLLAHRANDHLSLQVMPTMVHRNLSPLGEENDVFLCGVGGSFKINSRHAINVEYYPFVGNKPANKFGALSFGWDIETGGHVFQIVLSNTQAMTDNLFLSETTGSWTDGGIHLGFNLMRYFQVGGGGY